MVVAWYRGPGDTGFRVTKWIAVLSGPPGTLAAGVEVTNDWGFRLGRRLTRASLVTVGAYHQLRRAALGW